MKERGATRLLFLQTLVLFLGAAFAWSKLIPQLATFLNEYGTLLRFDNLALPNPLLTPCLYGSTAFLVVLYWSVRIFQRPHYRSERTLRSFLIFCVAFAASVVLTEAAAYYHIFTTSASFICTPGVPPTQTPCFIGMIFFIVALGISFVAVRRIEVSPEH